VQFNRKTVKGIAIRTYGYLKRFHDESIPTMDPIFVLGNILLNRSPCDIDRKWIKELINLKEEEE
jgi:hypothetical protein